MKIDLYTIGQYTDTLMFYVSRLESIGKEGDTSRNVILSNILTRNEAKAWVKRFNKNGLKPVSFTLLELNK